MDIKAVTQDSFATDVLASDKPVLVDFWAPWCGPCKKLAPVVAELAEQHADRLRVVKVDIDDHPGLATDYGVLSVPTLTLFVDGRAATSIIGAKPKKAIAEALRPWL